MEMQHIAASTSHDTFHHERSRYCLQRQQERRAPASRAVTYGASDSIRAAHVAAQLFVTFTPCPPPSAPSNSETAAYSVYGASLRVETIPYITITTSGLPAGVGGRCR